MDWLAINVAVLQWWIQLDIIGNDAGSSEHLGLADLYPSSRSASETEIHVSWFQTIQKYGTILSLDAQCIMTHIMLEDVIQSIT